MWLLENFAYIIFLFDCTATDRKFFLEQFFLADSGRRQFRVAFRNCP